MRMTVLSAALAIVAAFGLFVTFDVASAGSPPPGLSRNGRLLWQFEALLHDTFGKRPVCSSGRWAQNFTSGRCSPLAVYLPYFYVFAKSSGSAFHISAKKQVGGFGNYPVALLIRGRPVACNARETQFLILYRDTIFTLRCLRAGYVIP